MEGSAGSLLGRLLAEAAGGGALGVPAAGPGALGRVDPSGSAACEPYAGIVSKNARPGALGAS